MTAADALDSMGRSMADQATSPAERSATDPSPETPLPGAPAIDNAPGGTLGVEPGAPVAPAGSPELSAEPTSPGFGERGRMRRRVRFLRKARELAYRDLGGLVFEMQRLGERHDELVAAKLATLGAIDTELRALEDALSDRRALTVLRESGIAACPRCAAIHGSDDRFCPACGLAMGRRADRPIAAPVAGPGVAGPTAAVPTAAGTDRQAPLPSPMAPQPATPTPPAAPPTLRASATAPPSPVRPPASAPAPPSTARPPASERTPPAPDGLANDDRPTEIIRPTDPASDEGA
jgi:hypothetical protein